jgi:hypothetical protein
VPLCISSFFGDDWRRQRISLLDNFRSICSRIIDGDQAHFVPRRRFGQLGGLPDHLILKGVAFCGRLIRVTTLLPLSLPMFESF